MSINIFRDDRYLTQKFISKNIAQVNRKEPVSPLDSHVSLIWGETLDEKDNQTNFSFQHHLKKYLDKNSDSELDEPLASHYIWLQSLPRLSDYQQDQLFNEFHTTGLQLLHDLNQLYDGGNDAKFLNWPTVRLAKIIDTLFTGVTQYGHGAALLHLLDLFKLLDIRSTLHPHAKRQFQHMLCVPTFPLTAKNLGSRYQNIGAAKSKITAGLQADLRHCLSHEYFPSKLHELV